MHLFKIDKHIPMWFQSFEIFQNKFVVVRMDTEKVLVSEKVNFYIVFTLLLVKIK